MRIINLRFKAIGPFRNEVNIDFEKLSVSGLFLLEGPTGSGKSIIIDALVFALYGSAISDSQRLRSKFASTLENSEVDLYFEVPSGYYRIFRTPAYERPKLRGEGVTKEKASVKIWRFLEPDSLQCAIANPNAAMPSEPLAVRVEEVAQIVNEIIGLDKAQFIQTVVLPQGEFAQFLKAATSERQKLLERIFKTEHYSQIEQQFVEERKRVKNLLQHQQQNLTSQFKYLVKTSEENELADELANEAEFGVWDEAEQQLAAKIIAEIQAKLKALKAEAVAKTRHLEAHLDFFEDRKFKLNQQLEIIEARLTLDRYLLERQSKLALEAQAREALRNHEKALVPNHTAKQLQNLQKNLARQHEDLSRELEISALDASPNNWQMLYEKETQSFVSLNRSLGNLEASIADLKRLEQSEAELAKISTEYTNKDLSLQRLAAAQELLPQKIETLNDEISALETRVAEKSSLLLLEKSASSALELAKKYVKEIELQGEVETALLAARKEEDQVNANFLAIQSSYNQQTAGRLAKFLEADEPCLVCGSKNHPNPATIANLEVKEVDLENARNELDLAKYRITAKQVEAKKQGELAKATINELKEISRSIELELITDDFADQFTKAKQLVADTEVKLKEVKTSLSFLKEQEILLQQNKTLLKELEKENQQNIEQINKYRLELKELEGKRDGLKAQIDGFNAKIEQLSRDYSDYIPANVAGLAALRGAKGALTKAARNAEELAAKLEALIAAKELVDETTRDLNEQLAAAQIADEAALAKLILSTPEQQAQNEIIRSQEVLADRIKQLEARSELRDKKFSSQDLENTKNRISRLEERLEILEPQVLAASKAEALISRRESLTLENTAIFEKELERFEADGAELALLVQLANLITGDTSKAGAGVDLKTYVIIKRFEKVVEAANQRLKDLAGNELELRLRDHSVRKGLQKSGLDLEILDNRHLGVRNTSTLSGGETFFVSLSLALGLADVVVAESGGTQMNTLFIDEGFGTLDPEKLDSVIAQIRQLARHGRIVGIVSHVAELKNQIGEKIRVKRNQDKSSSVEIEA